MAWKATLTDVAVLEYYWQFTFATDFAHFPWKPKNPKNDQFFANTA